MALSPALEATITAGRWMELNTDRPLDEAALTEREPDFAVNDPTWLFVAKKVIEVALSVLFLPLTVLNWGRQYVGEQVLTLFYPSAHWNEPAVRSRALETARRAGNVARHVCLEKDGVKYSGMLVGSAEALQNGKWLVHATGNAEPAEATINYISENASRHGFATLIMNAPRTGVSEGSVCAKHMGAAHEVGMTFLETAFKAKTLVLSGRSMGGAAISQAILQHTFKDDVEYRVVREVTFSSISAMSKPVLGELFSSSDDSFIATIVRTIAAGIVHILGIDLDQTSASDKLERLGIKDVIVQKGNPRSETVEDDGIISEDASLAKALMDRRLRGRQFVHLIDSGNHNSDTMLAPIFEELGYCSA